MTTLTGRAKGGKATSDAMTPEQLRERAMKGVVAKKERACMVKITHTGTLDLNGFSLPCYVTESGQRLFSGRGLQDALRLVDEDTPNAQKPGSRVDRFITSKWANPLIYKDKPTDHFSPIKCLFDSKPISGYKAEILADICEAMLEARDLGLLTTPRRITIAKQCETLLRGFARVGLIALVDEATGYQDVRARNELNLILQSYIAKELLPWTKKFPDEFYKQIFRLHGWAFNPMSVRRPSYVGTLTNQLVYERLPEGVLEELKRINPSNDNGNRNHRHHQFLTERTGHPHLEKHIASVTTLLRISDNWEGFKKIFIKAFPITGDQQPLFEDDAA